MSQSKITTFANETLDKIFAYLTKNDDLFALIKTHRSFRASAQQLLFRENFRNLTSIDYKWCTYNPVTYGRAAVKRAGTASQLEKLRFTWYSGGHPWMGLDIGIASLWDTRHTLRELTVLPGMAFGGPLRLWSPATFIDFTALEILRVPALAFFQEVSCGGLEDDPDRAGFELRSDITPLLPPNVRELEIWFKCPSGIFATGGLKMRQFQELSEQERLKWFGWILALLQLHSLRRVRMRESLCAHDGGGWKQERGSNWPSCKFILPKVVSEAFGTAGVELEIEVLDKMAVYHGMY